MDPTSAAPSAPAPAASDATAAAPMPASAPASVLDRARTEVHDGRPWAARDLLLRHLDRPATATTTGADASAAGLDDALDLLGQVQRGMGDLPAAGAAWFAAGRRGPEVDAAVTAWREQHGDDFAAMWADLPAAVRSDPRSAQLRALQRRAAETPTTTSDAASRTVTPGAANRSGATTSATTGSGATASATKPASPASIGTAESTPDGGGFDAAQFIAWLLAAFFVLCSIVGLITILGWVVPD